MAESFKYVAIVVGNVLLLKKVPFYFFTIKLKFDFVDELKIGDVRYKHLT